MKKEKIVLKILSIFVFKKKKEREREQPDEKVFQVLSQVNIEDFVLSFLGEEGVIQYKLYCNKIQL